jgi:hypothetical protein
VLGQNVKMGGSFHSSTAIHTYLRALFCKVHTKTVLRVERHPRLAGPE